MSLVRAPRWTRSKSPPVRFRWLRERILDVNAEVAHGALNIRMSEQDLHGPQVAGLLVDDPECREVWTELIETIRRAAV